MYKTFFLLFLSSCAMLSGKIENPYLDATQEEIKKFKVVSLPFNPITSFFVNQGAYDNRKVGDEYTWNLQTAVNTPVLAMDSGRILRADNGFAEHGCNKKHEEKAQYVWIQHLDRTIAIYKHVHASVIKDQIVTKGQIIGYTNLSGNICRPELVISVIKSNLFMKSVSPERTVPLIFKNIPYGLLRSRQTY